ncbi:MAG TPA: twin-arginine translocation signal domain-containing protein [Stellaceae bacterium]|nr:twin-arginine translocation signal domain-containing protein [Stellaceae bacterium]
MTDQDASPTAVPEAASPRTHRTGRRRFLKGAGLAGAAVTAGVLLDTEGRAQTHSNERKLRRGDAAVLRLAAAAELIETDLWQQYAELGGVTSGAPNPYQLAFANLDGDGSQYITSNTLDEFTHADFINAYLASKGERTVNLDQFRTLPSSQATGAQQIGRLTNLTKLSVDTSWYTRYRSAQSPDFGASFPQALPALAAGQFTAIPRTDDDFTDPNHIQAIANTAAFHFGSIEQGGTSLYATLGQSVTSAEVLRIMFGIGGDEIAHFLEWVDFAGNGVQGPVAPFTDPTNGLTFPDFNATGNPLLQTNLIFPVPCTFISKSLPPVAVIRPITHQHFTAVGAIEGLRDSGLFIGQHRSFLDLLFDLAVEADEARRDD